jgi:hypothetical protein
MEELDLNQPAIVFWMHHPGEITRYERLQDAVHSVMVTPSAKMFCIAWITTRDRHIDMEEIRQIERHSILSRYLGYATSRFLRSLILCYSPEDLSIVPEGADLGLCLLSPFSESEGCVCCATQIGRWRDLFAIPTSPRSCAASYSSARAATQPAALPHGTVMRDGLCHQGNCGSSLGRFRLDLIFNLGLAGSGSSATGGALNPRTGNATNPNSPTLRGVFATV